MSDEAPGWVPEDLRRYWNDGALVLNRPRTVNLGDVPDGTTVRLDAGGQVVTVGAESVGAGVVLEVQAGDGNSTVVPQAVFNRVDVRRRHGRGRVDLNLTHSVSVHLHGRVQVGLRTYGEEPFNAKVQVRLEAAGDDVHVNGPDHVQITHLSGAGNLTLTGLELAGDVKVNLGGGLTRERAGGPAPFEAASATVAGVFKASSLVQAGTTVKAASIQLTNPGDVDRCVPPGADLTATGGAIYAKGAIGGSGDDDDRVSLTGAAGYNVTVLGAVQHADVAASTGQLDTVDLESASDVFVRGAAHVNLGGGEHPDVTVRDVTEFVTKGALRTFDVEATRADVGELMGTGRLVADRGTIRSAVTDAGRATVTVADWLRLGATAQLRIAAAEELVDGAVDVVFPSGRALDKTTSPTAVADDYLTADMQAASNPSSGDVHLHLSGRLRVRVPVEGAVVELTDGVEALLLDRAATVRTAESGPVGVGGIRALSELTLDGALSVASGVRAGDLVGADEAVLTAQTIEASTVLGCGLTCARLTVHGDVTDTDLDVQRATTVTGVIKSTATTTPQLSGEIHVEAAEVPLTLVDVRGWLGPEAPTHGTLPTFPEILLRGDSRGELVVRASVGRLRARGGGEFPVVQLHLRSVVSDLSVGGTLDLRGQTADGRDPDTSRVESLELAAGATLKTAGITRLPVTGLPAADEADATLQMTSAGSRVFLCTEAGSLIVETGESYELHSKPDAANDYEPSAVHLRLVGGAPTLRGAFEEVVFVPGSKRSSLSLPAESRVVAASGPVRLASLRGELTGSPTGWQRTARFRRDGSTLERLGGLGPFTHARVPDRLRKARSVFGPGGAKRLVVEGIDHDGKNAGRDFSGALVNADVTKLGRTALTWLAHLNEFAPEPVSLERRSRDCGRTAAERVRRANQLNDIANITREHASDGSTRTRARWSALHAHAATSGLPVSILHGLSRLLGYRQRPGPPLAMFVLLASLWLLLSYPGAVHVGDMAVPKPDDVETWMCETHEAGVKIAGSAAVGPSPADEIRSYGLYQRVERTLLAPTSTLKSLTGVSTNGLEPIGCGSFPGILVTVLLSITLLYGGIGLAKLVGPPALSAVRKR